MENTGIIPYKGDEPYIFVSYSHKNIPEVYSIIERLQKEGFRVWFDAGIDPGIEWAENIAERVTNCGYFIAMISSDFIQSTNCQDELSFARDRDKSRLVIYLEDVKLPDGMSMRLNRLQAIHKYTYKNENEFYEKLFLANGISGCRVGTDPASENVTDDISDGAGSSADISAGSQTPKTKKAGKKPGKKMTGLIAGGAAAVIAAAVIITVNITKSDSSADTSSPSVSSASSEASVSDSAPIAEGWYDKKGLELNMTKDEVKAVFGRQPDTDSRNNEAVPYFFYDTDIELNGYKISGCVCNFDTDGLQSFGFEIHENYDKAKESAGDAFYKAFGAPVYEDETMFWRLSDGSEVYIFDCPDFIRILYSRNVRGYYDLRGIDWGMYPNEIKSAEASRSDAREVEREGLVRCGYYVAYAGGELLGQPLTDTEYWIGLDGLDHITYYSENGDFDKVYNDMHRLYGLADDSYDNGSAFLWYFGFDDCRRHFLLERQGNGVRLEIYDDSIYSEYKDFRGWGLDVGKTLGEIKEAFGEPDETGTEDGLLTLYYKNRTYYSVENAYYRIAFKDDKASAINIEILEPKDYDKVLEAFKRLYGEPQRNDEQKRLDWEPLPLSDDKRHVTLFDREENSFLVQFRADEN